MKAEQKAVGRAETYNFTPRHLAETRLIAGLLPVANMNSVVQSGAGEFPADGFPRVVASR